MSKHKILIIEDEKNLAASLRIIFEAEGFEVKVCESGKEGLQNYLNYELLVLDLMLPDINGLEILQQIRSNNQKYPIMIVSAKSEEEDLIAGLSAGADDYLTKPFVVRELVLKIKRIFERLAIYESAINQRELKKEFIGNYAIDFSTLVAQTAEGEKHLTSQEANLLLFLFQNSGRVISRHELLEKVWGSNSEIETRTIDNFIVRFRKYFERDTKNPTHFITKRGVGYLFNVDSKNQNGKL